MKIRAQNIPLASVVESREIQALVVNHDARWVADQGCPQCRGKRCRDADGRIRLVDDQYRPLRPVAVADEFLLLRLGLRERPRGVAPTLAVERRAGTRYALSPFDVGLGCEQ